MLRITFWAAHRYNPPMYYQNPSPGGCNIIPKTQVDEESGWDVEDEIECLEGDDSRDDSTVNFPDTDTEVSDAKSVDSSKRNDTFCMPLENLVMNLDSNLPLPTAE